MHRNRSNVRCDGNIVQFNLREFESGFLVGVTLSQFGLGGRRHLMAKGVVGRLSSLEEVARQGWGLTWWSYAEFSTHCNFLSRWVFTCERLGSLRPQLYCVPAEFGTVAKNQALPACFCPRLKIKHPRLLWRALCVPHFPETESHSQNMPKTYPVAWDSHEIMQQLLFFLSCWCPLLFR